jgi:hypothetical protein
MTKINLIRMGWTDINKDYLEWTLQNQFELKVYVEKESYNIKSDILVITRPEFYNKEILFKFLDQGFKLLIVNLWEARPFVLSKDFLPYLDNILLVLGCKGPFDYGWKNILSVSRWFWYNESLWYTCNKNFQYQNYIPIRKNTKLFFMPIKRNKPFRTQTVERLSEFLDNAVWSYVERWNDGLHLPTREENPVAHIGWDRQFESSWYDDTYFTVAVETYIGQTTVENEMKGIMSDQAGPCELFVTEKTFKPIAHQHPFLICGMKGTLKFLKDNGFETYEHIFDESYDTLDFFDSRLDALYDNIKNFNKEKYLDSLTEQKIKHNYDRFYDRSAVLAGVNTDLIEPMLEWIHAT